jgi:predicted DNA-binding transcriptional regulator AlpA
MNTQNIRVDTNHIDPRAFGLVKAAYSVRETLEVISIGRTSLYDLVNRGELNPAKFGKKTLFLASDLAAFLTRLPNSKSRSAGRSVPEARVRGPRS